MAKKTLSVKSWRPVNRPERIPKIPILIVCEDSNYSQKYFNAIKNRYRLSNIDIPIRKAVGKSLQQLLDWTINTHNEKNKKYEEIYFVFDKDTHPDYQEVLDTIKKLRLKSREGISVKVKAGVAIPCFEFWLILHLMETSKPFATSLSSKEEWKKICKKTYPNKNSEEIFFILTDLKILSKAIERAKRSLESSSLNKGNPSTDIYILIERVINLIHIPNFMENRVKVETIA